MIMTKLYPIGTQLITRRLSQAALAEELGFLSYDCFDLEYTTWSVTVTEDNQPWLSSLIMVEDYVHFNRLNFGFLVDRVVDNEVFESNEPFFFASIEDEPKIISRFYPNGQRAPLIEWDEVILPETKGE
jgi:hypothetical protein